MSKDDSTPRLLGEEEVADLALAVHGSGSALDEQIRSGLHPDSVHAVEQTLAVLRVLSAPVELHEPPAHLWERIRGDLTDAPAPVTEPTSVTDLGGERRRRARWLVPVAAAAAGALIGGAAVGLALQNRTDEPSGGEDPIAAPQPRVVGTAELGPVSAEESTESARMRDHDGRLELEVTVPDVPDPRDGYYEVWLRDAEASRLISLGTVTAAETTLQVPEGIDFEAYPVVDISHEHFDGDPSHSGVTLWAGEMTESS